MELGRPAGKQTQVSLHPWVRKVLVFMGCYQEFTQTSLPNSQHKSTQGVLQTAPFC